MPPPWAHLLTLTSSNGTHLGGWGGAVREQWCGYVHITLFQNNRPCKLGTRENATPGRGHFTREEEVRPHIPQPDVTGPFSMHTACLSPAPSFVTICSCDCLQVADNASNLGWRALLWSVLLVTLLQSPVQRCLL